MININFDKPLLLLLLIPLLIIVILSFIFTFNKDNRSTKNIVSFIIHIILCVFITLTISKTTFELVVTKTEVYVLADVSYSSRNNLDLIDEYIENLEDNLPRNSKMGVICFGKDANTLVPLGEKLTSVKNANVDITETNITNALKYANELFSDDVIKRIVIISDGKETNQNNITSLIETLSLEEVYIDAIYVDNNILDSEKEVQISSVDKVPSTYINSQEKVYVSLESNTETHAMLSLYCNGEKYSEQALSLKKGFTTVSFNLKTDVAKTNKYEVVIEADNDTTKENNKYLFEQTIFDKINVLFIAKTPEEVLVAQDLYGDYANIEFYMNANKTIPYTVEELAKYDEFVLSNVDVRELNNASQFVASLDILVSEYGKSLLTIGNTYIQNNKEDETLMALNDMLPVKYGNDEQETKLVTLIMDYSRSMEQIDKLNMSKKIASTILDNLADNVMVLVIGFYGEVVNVYNVASASERDKIKEAIEKQEAYQGTFMGSALAYAYSYINSLGYKKNEVILISDGLPYGEQEAATKYVAEQMAKKGMALSTINTISAEGAALMAELARIGKGKAYSITSLKEVDALVLDEVLDSLKDMVLENTNMEVSILLENDELIKGISSLPDVNGIYNNISKYNANVVLNAKYIDVVTEREYEIPLYSYWNYGNGRVSSFASNINGNWIEGWMNNSDCEKVFDNMLYTNIPLEQIHSAFVISNETKGTLTDIVVKAPIVNKDATLKVSITNPNGDIVDTNLIFDTSNYITTIKTEQIGEYKVELEYIFGELTYTNEYTFYVSYLPEYDTLDVFDASNLYYMVTMNGQISEDGKLNLENNMEDIKKYIFDLTPILMIISIILFISDVIIRKLRWQDIVSLFKKHQKKNEQIKEEK